MKINKNIFLKVIEKEGVSSSNLIAGYNWVTPTATSDFSASDIESIKNNNHLVFNFFKSISEHLREDDISHISSKAMGAISIGKTENILTQDGEGVFSGEDALYIPGTKDITNWTVILDAEIEVFRGGKGKILLTNRKNITDTTGWMIGINGYNRLFYEAYDKDNVRHVYTAETIKLSSKCLIAVSKSQETNLLSFVLHDPSDGPDGKTYDKTISIPGTQGQLGEMTVGATFEWFASTKTTGITTPSGTTMPPGTTTLTTPPHPMTASPFVCDTLGSANIVNHMKTSLVADGAIMIGEAHGQAASTNWLADNIADLFDNSGQKVLFSEFTQSHNTPLGVPRDPVGGPYASYSSRLLNEFQNKAAPRYGTPEHCALIMNMFGGDSNQSFCCPEAWDPDHFSDEWIRVYEAAIVGGVHIVGVDCERMHWSDPMVPDENFMNCAEGTGSFGLPSPALHSNEHWANVINEYILNNNWDPNVDRFIIYGGAGHNDKTFGVDKLIYEGGDEDIGGGVKMEIKSYDFQYPSQPYLEKVCWSCWDGLWPPGIGNMLGCIYTTATIETSVVADCQALFAGTTHVREVISGASDDGCCPTIANEDYTEFFLNCSGTHLGLGAWNQPPCICMGPIVAGHWADGSPPSGGINADFGISIGGCSEDKQNYLSYKEAAGVCSPIPAVGDPDHSGIPGFNYGEQTIRPACAVEPCTGCPGMIELGHTPVVEGAWDGNTGTSTYTSPIEGGLTTSVVTHDCGVGSLVGAGEFCYQCFKPSDANDGSGKGPCDFDLTGAWNGWAVCMDLFFQPLPAGVAACCPTTAEPTTTTLPPECGLTEIFDHIKGNIDGHGGVFLGDAHGRASVTNWIADNVGGLLPIDHTGVLFIEMVHDDQQFFLDIYQSTDDPRYGSPEHCALTEQIVSGHGYGWDDKSPHCCPNVWNPDNFVDEYVRVIEACVASNIKVIGLDCVNDPNEPLKCNYGYGESPPPENPEGTRNQHWANIINEYLSNNPNDKFIIFAGNAHSSDDAIDLGVGVEQLITDKTVVSYDFQVPGWLDPFDTTFPINILGCGGSEIMTWSGDAVYEVSTGLGEYQVAPCICMQQCPDEKDCDYWVSINDCHIHNACSDSQYDNKDECKCGENGLWGPSNDCTYGEPTGNTWTEGENEYINYDCSVIKKVGSENHSGEGFYPGEQIIRPSCAVTTTIAPPECDLINIFNHVHGNVSNNGCVFLGDIGGTASITNWVADNVAGLFSNTGEKVLFMGWTVDQLAIDAYQDKAAPRHGTAEYCALTNFPGGFAGGDHWEPECCQDAWSPDQFADEYIRVVEACTVAGVKVVAGPSQNSFEPWDWAKLINQYLAANNWDSDNDWFILFGGEHHSRRGVFPSGGQPWGSPTTTTAVALPDDNPPKWRCTFQGFHCWFGVQYPFTEGGEPPPGWDTLEECWEDGCGPPPGVNQLIFEGGIMSSCSNPQYINEDQCKCGFDGQWVDDACWVGEPTGETWTAASNMEVATYDFETPHTPPITIYDPPTCSGGAEGLGLWDTPPCMCLKTQAPYFPGDLIHPFSNVSSDYVLSVNACNEDLDEYINYDCTEISQLPRVCTTTTTTVAPTCDLTEIFNHIKENVDTAAHGVFLGEAHGIASISNWIADHVATLLPTDGTGVLFMEAMYSDDQLILDAYQNTDDPRYGSIEHCDLLDAMSRSVGLAPMCCSEAWDPVNFPDEYARIIEACVANNIKVISIDVDGTMAVRNAHWASVINGYLTSFPNHKFIIHGGAGHSEPAGVDQLITGKTVISYDFMTPGWGGAWPNFYDCDGVLDSGGGSTSLGPYETSPCMCLRGCYDGTGCDSDYVIWINDCAEPTYSCSDPQYTTQETCEAAVETWLTFEKYVNYNCSVIPSVGSANHSGNGGFNPGEQIIPVLCPTTTTAEPTTTTAAPSCPGCVDVTGFSAVANGTLNGTYTLGIEGSTPFWEGKQFWTKYTGGTGFVTAAIYYNPTNSRWEMSYTLFSDNTTGVAWWATQDSDQACPFTSLDSWTSSGNVSGNPILTSNSECVTATTTSTTSGGGGTTTSTTTTTATPTTTTQPPYYIGLICYEDFGNNFPVGSLVTFEAGNLNDADIIGPNAYLEIELDSIPGGNPLYVKDIVRNSGPAGMWFAIGSATCPLSTSTTPPPLHFRVEDCEGGSLYDIWAPSVPDWEVATNQTIGVSHYVGFYLGGTDIATRCGEVVERNGPNLPPYSASDMHPALWSSCLSCETALMRNSANITTTFSPSGSLPRGSSPIRHFGRGHTEYSALSTHATTTTETPNPEYERLSDAKINHLILFNTYIDKQKISNILESFFLTAYTDEHYEDVMTEFKSTGEKVKVKVRDGYEIAQEAFVEETITTNTGETLTIYKPVSVHKPRFVEKWQILNHETKTFQKAVSTFIPESKTKDNTYATTYSMNECILLDGSVDTAEYAEFYFCDENFDGANKQASFAPGIKSFKLDKVYGANEVQVYQNGKRLVFGEDYEINDKKIKKLGPVPFIEPDVLMYDAYEATENCFDFFGWPGDIYLAGDQGKDVYLDGMKLVKDVDYEDVTLNGYEYLRIFGGLNSQGSTQAGGSEALPNGKICLVEKYSGITETLNFRGTPLNCPTNHKPIYEIAWIGGKKAVKDVSYSITSMTDPNNSIFSATDKTKDGNIIFNVATPSVGIVQGPVTTTTTLPPKSICWQCYQIGISATLQDSITPENLKGCIRGELSNESLTEANVWCEALTSDAGFLWATQCSGESLNWMGAGSDPSREGEGVEFTERPGPKLLSKEMSSMIHRNKTMEREFDIVKKLENADKNDHICGSDIASLNFYKNNPEAAQKINELDKRAAENDGYELDLESGLYKHGDVDDEPGGMMGCRGIKVRFVNIWDPDDPNLITEAQCRNVCGFLTEAFNNKLPVPSRWAVDGNCNVHFCYDDHFNTEGDGVPYESLTLYDIWTGEPVPWLIADPFDGAAEPQNKDYLYIYVCPLSAEGGFATRGGIVSHQGETGPVIGTAMWFMASGGRKPRQSCDAIVEDRRLDDSICDRERNQTVTHEVGHWFGLEHIWGGGILSQVVNTCWDDDGVVDTPRQDGPTTSIARLNLTPAMAFAINTCGGDPPDMWENWMDYASPYAYAGLIYSSFGDPPGAQLFTVGQCIKMRTFLDEAIWDNPDLNHYSCCDENPECCCATTTTTTTTAGPWNCYRCLDQYQSFLFCFWTPPGTDWNYARDDCVQASDDQNASVESDPEGTCCPTTTTAAPTCYSCRRDDINGEFLFCFWLPVGLDDEWAQDWCIMGGDSGSDAHPDNVAFTWPDHTCCTPTTTTAAPTTTTTVAPTCDLTEIFNHVKGNITANGGVFLGDNHGAAAITGWISDHVATLGINVFFIEMIASSTWLSPMVGDQATLDAYVNGGGVHGSTEHCNLIEAMTGWDTKEAYCCLSAWDPDNFADEYIRIIDACISASIVVKALDTTGTLDQRNAHWASIVNTYLTANPSHKFVIYGGAGHSANYPANQGVDMRITGKTVISYDFNSPFGSSDADCDGVTIDGVTTGLGAWENQKCMCMLSCVDPLNCDYQIYVNDCNQAGDEYVDYDCTIVTQLVRPACPTTTTCDPNDPNCPTTPPPITTTTTTICPSNCGCYLKHYYPPNTNGVAGWEVGDMVSCCENTNGCFQGWPPESPYNDTGEYVDSAAGCWRVIDATLANQTGTNPVGMNGPDGYPGGPTDWWYASPNLSHVNAWEWVPACPAASTTTTAEPCCLGDDSMGANIPVWDPNTGWMLADLVCYQDKIYLCNGISDCGNLAGGGGPPDNQNLPAGIVWDLQHECTTTTTTTTTTTQPACVGCVGMIGEGKNPQVLGHWAGNTGVEDYECDLCGDLSTSVVTRDCGSGLKCYECTSSINANDGNGQGPCEDWGWAECTCCPAPPPPRSPGRPRGRKA